MSDGAPQDVDTGSSAAGHDVVDRSPEMTGFRDEQAAKEEEQRKQLKALYLALMEIYGVIDDTPGEEPPGVPEPTVHAPQPDDVQFSDEPGEVDTEAPAAADGDPEGSAGDEDESSGEDGDASDEDAGGATDEGSWSDEEFFPGDDEGGPGEGGPDAESDAVDVEASGSPGFPGDDESDEPVAESDAASGDTAAFPGDEEADDGGAETGGGDESSGEGDFPGDGDTGEVTGSASQPVEPDDGTALGDGEEDDFDGAGG